MLPRRLLQLILAILLFVFGIALGVGLTREPQSVQNSLTSLLQSHPQTDFRQFETVWNDLHARYIDAELNDSQLVRGAIRGLVEALGDPYSAYLDESETVALEQDIDGTFEGVGMEIGVKNDQLTIIAPLAGSPAEKSGLRAGDQILAIDDQPTATLNLFEAVDAIRGGKGTSVTLDIRREGEALFQVTVQRDTIHVESVTSRMIEATDGSIAYIRITAFNSDTISLFRQQARSLLTKNSIGFIIDLRGNPGGLLDQSVDVASTFIESGVIVSEVKRDGRTTDFEASGDSFLSRESTVVLVNGGSASASEIVAGALQDTKRAIIMGEQTFGKGTVQDLTDLPDGSTLKLTIAEWRTPAGRSIQKQGIAPDLVVERTSEDIENDRDPQLDRAVEFLQTQ